jgi:hypothetical protein
MRTANLQFNIIYTPGTARYLSPFVLTLLRWSDCRYRLVANGCSDDEVELLRAVTALDERLELLIMPEKRMLPHGETLDYLHERTDSDHFCFMDSDILAVGPFLDDFRDEMRNSDLFSSCLPLWHNEKDTVIPDHFEHMHGIHAYTADGLTIACDYFVAYDNRTFVQTRKETGAGLRVMAWQELSAGNQRVISDLGQKRLDYDSGKVLTLLMIARGHRIGFRQSDNLKHIGGFTEAGTGDGGPLYNRGRLDGIAAKLPRLPGLLVTYLADAWYATIRRLPETGLRENISLASRLRRRTATAKYFYLLIVGLMDDKPVPKVPVLGDRVAEARLGQVSREIAELITQVRSESGPWQDKPAGSTNPA